MLQKTGIISSWSHLVREVETVYRLFAYEDPSHTLFKFTQEESVIHYYSNFKALASRVDGISPTTLLKQDIDRSINLVLEGLSRIGKAAWAWSLGQHNYICGHLDFNPVTFRNAVMYNVIDDVTPNYLKLKH